jgi:hypothetical protein
MSDRQDYRATGSISQSQYDSLNEREHRRMLEERQNSSSPPSSVSHSGTGGNIPVPPWSGHIGGFIIASCFWPQFVATWSSLQHQLAPSLPFGLSYIVASGLMYIGTLCCGYIAAYFFIVMLGIALVASIFFGIIWLVGHVMH